MRLRLALPQNDSPTFLRQNWVSHSWKAAARDAPIGRPGGRAMSNAQLLLTNVSVKLHHERR